MRPYCIGRITCLARSSDPYGLKK